MYINTVPNSKLETCLPKVENYISLEIQQKTKYLLEIWRTIGDNSPLPASLQQHAKDEVLVNLIKLIKEVFPKQEGKLKEPIPMKTLKPLSAQDKEFITYLEELVRVAESQKNDAIEKALGPSTTDSIVHINETKNYPTLMGWRGKEY